MHLSCTSVHTSYHSNNNKNKNKNKNKNNIILQYASVGVGPELMLLCKRVSIQNICYPLAQ